ncbi:hypothetical protein [Streptomyces sp. NBC_00620]|uniref:hypothetical protein n=1 Tax=Streptomyces sp. NBC_00620 TaxID=2903666 RepID=UPI00225480F2|nr:hypothetical protein [Streptomyces sp. NBC_00620]MCX4972189.1 hypothetical protein [Streptomyces sp. NBC_00620]
MATSTRNPGTRYAGRDWLAECAPTPDAVHRAWSAGELALVPSGLRWLVVEAPLLPSVDAMQRMPPDGLGPVLAYPAAERAWWLVPLDAAEHLDDVARLTVHPPLWPLYCPPVNRPTNGRVWLARPHGSGRLTDPTVLGACFGPGGRLPAEAFG